MIDKVYVKYATKSDDCVSDKFNINMDKIEIIYN